ncbi:hypothetical protein D3C80_1445000 [compost metagenome]
MDKSPTRGWVLGAGLGRAPSSKGVWSPGPAHRRKVFNGVCGGSPRSLLLTTEQVLRQVDLGRLISPWHPRKNARGLIVGQHVRLRNGLGHTAMGAATPDRADRRSSTVAILSCHKLPDQLSDTSRSMPVCYCVEPALSRRGEYSESGWTDSNGSSNERIDIDGTAVAA